MDFIKAVEAYSALPNKNTLDLCVKSIMAEMTVPEKIKMLSGHAMKTTVVNVFKYGRYYNATPYGAGGCRRLNIPEMLFSDGPRGCVMGKSTCFPVSVMRAATFDTDLEFRVGQAIADECIAGGANYFAGICINLLRNPRWGRAQETYGEDQCLLGEMGAALTRAVQSRGMIACPKHFALNSIEDLRFSVDAHADARTLREVYLPHFQKCIDAGALSIMGAYNKVNGVYCCENTTLLKDILRGEMGFDGFVSSDFAFGVYDAARSLKAGVDVEMPYTYRFRKLKKYLKKGRIAIDDIDASVYNILSVFLRSLPNIKPVDKSVIVCEKHTALAREAAEKGITLLKNNGILPLKKNLKLAVIGRYANKVNIGDKGSSRVYSPYSVTPYEGLINEFGKENVFCYNGANVKKAVAAAKQADVVVLCVGSDFRQEGEFLVNFGKIRKKPRGMGGDRTDMLIPPEDKKLIDALHGINAKIIVNVLGGSAFVIEDWKDKADAILFSFYSGLEGGNALARVLSGAVNPSGRLPFSIAKSQNDYPSFLQIGDGRYQIEYGYYHGYALFDKKGIDPAYPFGFGLSYTETHLSDFKVGLSQDAVTIEATAYNSGDRDGSTVVQVYCGGISDKEADRPIKQLKAFKRVALKSGQRQKVKLEIPFTELRYYDEGLKQFTNDKAYNVFIGENSQLANDNKFKVTL